MKVAISVSELSEEGLLEEAARLIDTPVVQGSYGAKGFRMIHDGVSFFVDWDCDLEFTLSQLKDLGFEVGGHPDGTNHCSWCEGKFTK